MFNTERFVNTKFTDECIEKSSKIQTQHIDKRQANWAQTYIKSHFVSDEIYYLDVGAEIERDFFSFDITNLQMSYADDFEATYKIAGMTIFRELDLEVTKRTTYDFLSFLGDVGGLDGILIIVGYLMINWY